MRSEAFDRGATGRGMSVKGAVELLRQVPLFTALDPAQLHIVVFSAERVSIPAGEYVLAEGRSENAGFLVFEGEGEAYGQGPEPVARVERGAFVGELQMVAKVPASLSVRAISDMETLRIGNELFMRVCREFPEAGARMLQILSRRLDATVRDFRAVQRPFEKNW